MTRSSSEDQPFFEIPEYHRFLSPRIARHLLAQAHPLLGLPELVQLGQGGGLETRESLRFLVGIYDAVKGDLARVLQQRVLDREFIDTRVRALSRAEVEVPFVATRILGLQDGVGRIVFGPKGVDGLRRKASPVAPLPEYLKGPHITLFGPPDTAKMAINAMNAFHRKLPGEPVVVEELLSRSRVAPMWGADDEDSKTPLREDLVDAGKNLKGCFDRTLKLEEGARSYSLANERLALPIKRFPGLALPASYLFYRRNPLPLHLYDFVLHVYEHWSRPEALVFYVPKLENEEEAAYIRKLIAETERKIQELHPSYVLGTIRLMIVLENPRAILRIQEFIDELHPYFAGASLGWHDYLASTARLFKEDPNYRIPVKADPEIVIKHIKASHDLLAEVVGERGGVKIGGMYGVLPVAGDPKSLQVALRGFFRDVVTQLRRGLNGFWVAHPDFVRLGIALVEAWEEKSSGDPVPLRRLVEGYLDPKVAAETMQFIESPDRQGLDTQDPAYIESLIVTNLRESEVIANHDPAEVRYNVAQTLHYLLDWCAGNGCVALPTTIDGVPVRVMDDLATTERSRWEVWAEVRHGRFSKEALIRIAHEEMRKISAAHAKWKPVAMRVLLKLMTDAAPPEFVTELLIPFTAQEIRGAADPLGVIDAIDPAHLALDAGIARYHEAFEACGAERFARVMADQPVFDLERGREVVLSFTLDEIKSAASFHGDIGQKKETLDATAAREQAKVSETDDSRLERLREPGGEYLKKFGFKFLVSAQGRTAHELQEVLETRLVRTFDEEIEAAREALWMITEKRLSRHAQFMPWLRQRLEEARVSAISVAVSGGGSNGQPQVLEIGCERGEAFEIASLSKTLGAAFALEYARRKGWDLDTSVQDLLTKLGSSIRIESAGPAEWVSELKLRHLMDHSALGMHYVNGFPKGRVPDVAELIEGQHGYTRLKVVNRPGTQFQYSGGGFLVLQHLIERAEGRPIAEITEVWIRELGLEGAVSFDPKRLHVVDGELNPGQPVSGGRFDFPAFAAGGFGTSEGVWKFLRLLESAYHSLDGVPGLAHDTAVEMLHAKDRGCVEFMGARMGLGVFVAEAGPNRFALHQGANEGFRALYAHCFAGPDRGKGFVVFANGGDVAVPLIADVARKLFGILRVQGLDWNRVQGFDSRGVRSEQIVNLGYKALLFDAFVPDLPEAIQVRGPRHPLADRNALTGARVLQVTNQKFARAEQLVSPFEPTFDPALFGRQGKIMDSWETVRHNELGSDRLELALAQSSCVRWVRVSTEFHDGNQAEGVRLLGRTEGGPWIEFLPRTALEGHALLEIDLDLQWGPFDEIAVEIHPDGGLSRLGLYDSLAESEAESFKPRATARPIRFASTIGKTVKPLALPLDFAGLTRRGTRNLASLSEGAKLLRATNEHYGPAIQVLSPFPALHMFDGLESARSRKPGHFEEVEIRLASRARVREIVFDFEFFVNNNPVAIEVDARDGSSAWKNVVPRTPVKAFAGNRRSIQLPEGASAVTDLRVRTLPDGGINRIRVYGES